MWDAQCTIQSISAQPPDAWSLIECGGSWHVKTAHRSTAYGSRYPQPNAPNQPFRLRRRPSGKDKDTSNKETAQVLGILNVRLLAISHNEDLRPFLRGVASSVIYYDLFITRIYPV